ncbi:MAG: hypothetical protein JO279_01380 [Verrucomicrobia bacterium]|nr:hypothetical protein [Verrucomicrobiota bacterium]
MAQKEVSSILASLPKLEAVLTQGGDVYGVAMAFKAANRLLPIIVMGNRQDELALWKSEHEANGYERVLTVMGNGKSCERCLPLAGKKVKKG